MEPILSFLFVSSPIHIFQNDVLYSRLCFFLILTRGLILLLPHVAVLLLLLLMKYFLKSYFCLNYCIVKKRIITLDIFYHVGRFKTHSLPEWFLYFSFFSFDGGLRTIIIVNLNRCKIVRVTFMLMMKVTCKTLYLLNSHTI